MISAVPSSCFPRCSSIGMTECFSHGIPSSLLESTRPCPRSDTETEAMAREAMESLVLAFSKSRKAFGAALLMKPHLKSILLCVAVMFLENHMSEASVVDTPGRGRERLFSLQIYVSASQA